MMRWPYSLIWMLPAWFILSFGLGWFLGSFINEGQGENNF